MSIRHASPDSAVILAAELRRKLNSIGKQKFYAMVRAGRFQHLEAVGPSSVLGYTVYSRKRVDEWIDGPTSAWTRPPQPTLAPAPQPSAPEGKGTARPAVRRSASARLPWGGFKNTKETKSRCR